LLNEVKMIYTTEEIQELYKSFSAEEKERLELAVQTRNERKGIAENKDSLTELIDYLSLYTSPSPRDKRQSRMPSSA